MPRHLRCADAGYVYHMLNRTVGQATLFDKAANAACEMILRQAWVRSGMRYVPASTDGAAPPFAVRAARPGQATQERDK